MYAAYLQHDARPDGLYGEELNALYNTLRITYTDATDASLNEAKPH